ncbi:MAG: hypothetical protein Phog2KO_11490 [Phototrophicaceae bacterium]
MPHIFISYAKKDTRKLALNLADALNALDDVTAWVDRSLRAGKSWELQIQTEIDRCDAMVVLYSPDINRHKDGKPESYVLTEIAYAKYTLSKLIIPVMAKLTTPPISLTTSHYIDFTLDDLKLNDLVEALCYELEIEAVVSTSPSIVTEKPIIVEKPKITIPSKPTSLSLKAKPFDWVAIPAGRVTLGKSWDDKAHSAGKTFKVGSFDMAKYPVTNAQYAKFIEAGGYENDAWWTETGWRTRQKENWIEPRYWADSKWNTAEQPVVGVSWYESIAFCLWLSEATGEKISLPTEQQWQYAAQGDDGRTYPWGNQWDSSKCQNSVDGGLGSAGQTSPVTQYEGKGDSPFGVVDMAGNVWEWCLTEYKTGSQVLNGTDIRVLRGGSWKSGNTDNFLCHFRTGSYSINRVDFRGFRIVRNK